MLHHTPLFSLHKSLLINGGGAALGTVFQEGLRRTIIPFDPVNFP